MYIQEIFLKPIEINNTANFNGISLYYGIVLLFI